MDTVLAVFKALSDRNRLRAVAALMEHDELCAFQIVELLQIRGATVSRHLGQLVSAGILQSRKDGRWVYYALNRRNEALQPVAAWIRTHLGSDETLADDRKKLETIIACDPEDLCRRQRGEACCPRKKTDH